MLTNIAVLVLDVQNMLVILEIYITNNGKQNQHESG